MTHPKEEAFDKLTELTRGQEDNSRLILALANWMSGDELRRFAEFCEEEI
jgi:hypothetical protein